MVEVAVLPEIVNVSESYLRDKSNAKLVDYYKGYVRLNI